jgi:hypothetical protein
MTPGTSTPPHTLTVQVQGMPFSSGWSPWLPRLPLAARNDDGVVLKGTLPCVNDVDRSAPTKTA